MDIVNIEINWIEYSSIDELDAKDQDLLQLAKSQCDKAYAPYSNFYVGSALRTTQNSIYLGSNMENASSPLGICSEGAVLTAYSSAGMSDPIDTVAISARSNDFMVNSPIPPCGGCRQMLLEFEQRQDTPIKLILQGEEGKIVVLPQVSILLPLQFSFNHLSKL